MTWKWAVAYLSFGLIFHIVFRGGALDAANAWTWVWLFGWLPILVLCAFAVVVVIALIFCLGRFIVMGARGW